MTRARKASSAATPLYSLKSVVGGSGASSVHTGRAFL
jgi:hypothetical protein